MTRLIDADALKAEWYRINDIDETDRGVRFVGYTEIARLIDNAPTVQADGDLISRQNAVKEIDSFCGEVWTESEADFARGLGTALSIVESLPSAEQVTGKLNNPDNSLLTADSEACKEQKSKLDLIRRQDAILAITGEPPEAHYPSWYAERIKALPSAPDSRQRGEWVRNDKIGTFKIFTCDKCGCNMDTDAWDFCPNCGAYMGGQYDGQKR